MLTPLARYLADKPRGEATRIAGRLGVSDSFVCRLANGTRFPGLRVAIELERVTGGDVPATAWLPRRRSRARTIPTT